MIDNNENQISDIELWKQLGANMARRGDQLWTVWLGREKLGSPLSVAATSPAEAVRRFANAWRKGNEIE